MSVQDCSWAASGPGRCQKDIDESYPSTHILTDPISLVLAVHIYAPDTCVRRDSGDDRAENGKRGKPNHVEGRGSSLTSAPSAAAYILGKKQD